MVSLAGYQLLTVIFEGRKTLIYRAQRLRDKAPVLCKVLKAEYPPLPDITRLRHEYEITQPLHLEGIVKPYGLEKHGHSLALILEDFGGHSLKQTNFPDPLDVVSFLRIAIQLAETLEQLQHHNIIHKDITPDKILINLASGQVKITGFGLASRLAQENQPATNPNVLEGTLAYMSPEQTGRMNRAVDYRTDFYSLGVTFYELLTGQLPFQTGDPMELVHAHLAKQPVPPLDRNLAIPPALSAIVMKCLAKTAEDRYQSAAGLKADLELCLNQRQAGRPAADFQPGRQDISDRFQIPQKLYGRELEIEALLAAIERVIGAGSGNIDQTSARLAQANGSVELMLVSGYAGVGKSALVNEVHKPISRQKGFFIAGKFDQFQRNIPYRAIIQAFQDLVRQLLTESESRIEVWRERLLRALGANGQVIAEVIPEVELIIGPQPVVPDLPPAERQNRFNLVFEYFVQVFTQKEHPLIIFLDDLQWADSATLSLLQTLITSRHMHHLLVIGAYRDNEVTPAHPLMLALTEIARMGVKINQITLSPLDLLQLTRLTADTLKTDLDRARPLAELILSKTGGNPFFVIQFLTSLYQENLLQFDHNRAAWRFNLDRIRQLSITDNIVALMASKIQKLSLQTQHVARLAACIGNRFDLATLAIVSEQPLSQTLHDLRPAVHEGLILPINKVYEGIDVAEPQLAAKAVYKFLHDRVQQAAYSLIPEDQKKSVHLNVGRLLLEHSSEADREENLFDIVNHLNHGADLISEAETRIELAFLNRRAGQRAKSSTAYKAALAYFKAGLELLSQESWTSEYDLTFALYRDLAESEYLCGNFERAEQHFELLLGQARSDLEKAEIYNLRIIQFENTARYSEAIQAGQAGLKLFGLSLPELDAEKQTAFEQELRLIWIDMGARKIETLIHSPVMIQPEMKMSMKLLMTLWAPAYIAGDRLLPALISATMVRLSLAYGHTEESAYGYMTHGITVGSSLGDFKSGYEFGKLALKVNEQFNDPKLKAKVHHMFSCFVNLWRMPLKSCFPHSREAYRSGLESGDFVYATYAIFHESWYALLCGQALRQFQSAYQSNLTFLIQIQNYSFVDAQRVILQWGLSLEGLTEGKALLTGEAFDEQRYLETYRGDAFFETFYCVAKLHLLYLFGYYVEAKAMASQATQVVHSLNGTIWGVVLCFYHALTLTALYPSASRLERAAYWRTLLELRARMERWAEHCPENFQHRFLLIAAEMARIKRKTTRAIPLYEQAIQLAAEHEFRHDRALANELYARFWLEQKHEKIARLYLAEAHFAYEEQEALAKVRDLEEKYTALLGPTPGMTGPPVSMAQTTPTALDLTAAMKAAQIISGEIVLDTLMERLVQIVIQHAGAQKGLLIGVHENRWVIEAAGLVDRDEITVVRGLPLKPDHYLALSVANYVKRTGECLVIVDAKNDDRFANDPYINRHKPGSILCMPIVSQAKLARLLYLENNLATGAFTPDRIEMMRMLSAQAAISLENARLYEEMKRENGERTRAEAALRQSEQQLRQVNEQLEDYGRNLEEKVTKRTREIEQRRQVAESLRDILPILNSSRPFTEILDHIAVEASRLLDSDSSAIHQFASLTGLQISQSPAGQEVSNGGLSIDLGEGRPIVISDITTFSAPASNGQEPPFWLPLNSEYRAWLGVPLFVSNQLFGCLVLRYARPRHFSAEEIDLAMAFSDQAALAIENARLRQRVERAAVLEERGRLARELHDSVTQSLYSLTLLAEGWRRLARTGRLANIENGLVELGEIAQQALKEMRLLVYELRPSPLEQAGLVGALQQRLKSVEQRAGMEAHLFADETVELTAAIEGGLYRIAQEALNNTLKHTTATSVKVYLHTDTENVVLEIMDNGQGFDAKAARHRGGLGLISMQERAEKLGGRLTIDSTVGMGTTIRVKFNKNTTEVTE